MLQFQGEFQPENESFRTNISLLRVFICTGAVRCFGGPALQLRLQLLIESECVSEHVGYRW
jgi:hypothetical protein